MDIYLGDIALDKIHVKETIIVMLILLIGSTIIDKYASPAKNYSTLFIDR